MISNYIVGKTTPFVMLVSVLAVVAVMAMMAVIALTVMNLGMQWSINVWLDAWEGRHFQSRDQEATLAKAKATNSVAHYSNQSIHTSFTSLRNFIRLDG